MEICSFYWPSLCIFFHLLSPFLSPPGRCHPIGLLTTFEHCCTFALAEAACVLARFLHYRWYRRAFFQGLCIYSVLLEAIFAGISSRAYHLCRHRVRKKGVPSQWEEEPIPPLVVQI